jgi:hypothetical protein
MEKTVTVTFTVSQLASVAASLHLCGQNAVMKLLEPNPPLQIVECVRDTYEAQAIVARAAGRGLPPEILDAAEHNAAAARSMIADMKARADKTAAEVAADIERIRTQGKAATDTAQPVDPIDDLLSRLRSSFPGAQIIRG